MDLCLVLGGVAGFLYDLQQPPGQALDQGLQVLGEKVASTKNSCNLVISGPIDLNFSALLPETNTFRKKYKVLC